MSSFLVTDLAILILRIGGVSSGGVGEDEGSEGGSIVESFENLSISPSNSMSSELGINVLFMSNLMFRSTDTVCQDGQ